MLTPPPAKSSEQILPRHHDQQNQQPTMGERTQERMAHSDIGDLYRGKYKDSTAGDAMHK